MAACTRMKRSGDGEGLGLVGLTLGLMLGLDTMAVTASARRAHTTAAYAGPAFEGGLLGGS
jgi:hypothetical protein